MNIDDARIIDLTKILDSRGNLSIIEENKDIPFKIERTYWIYDVPGGEVRGGHAYKENQEFIVALSGSFDVVLDDGKEQKIFSLNRSYYGLYVPKGMWRQMKNFSTNSLALVLSSTKFDENDYVMDYKEYKTFRKDKTDFPIIYKNKNVILDNSSNVIQIKSSNVFDCSLCKLNQVQDQKGNLTYIYENIHLPFSIRRVFYSYDIPGGEERGAHAHKKCHQFLIAASGSFEVVLDDGINKRTVLLNRPFWGLHIPPGIWASEQGFSSGSICLVLASDEYDADDYIRNYNDYIEYRIYK
ncbi:MAG: WxcM-like domain-containing protein [Clostridia bacterium]|nr:WxcM-like domain-containing protein [Clostridia bacterium]